MSSGRHSARAPSRYVAPYSALKSPTTYREQALARKVVHLQTTSSEITLEVPDLTHYFPSMARSPSAVQLRDDLISIHQEYSERATPWIFNLSNSQERRKYATRSLQSVVLAVPGFDRMEAQLCIAAWLCFFCAFDDVVEAISDGSEVTDVLNAAERIFSRTTSTDQHRPMSNGPPQTLTDKATHLARCFVRYTSHLLRNDSWTCSRFLESCAEWIHVLHQEDRFRRSKSRNHEKYLAIRTQTMGLEPLFCMIDSSTNWFASEPLRRLKSLVALATGIQNDLVGIEKDLRQGEFMNAVIVASGAGSLEAPENSTITKVWPYVQAMTARHNDLVRHACREYATIRQSADLRAEHEFAGYVFGFLTRHVEWMASVKRYRIDDGGSHGM